VKIDITNGVYSPEHANVWLRPIHDGGAVSTRDQSGRVVRVHFVVVEIDVEHIKDEAEESRAEAVAQPTDAGDDTLSYS